MVTRRSRWFSNSCVFQWISGVTLNMITYVYKLHYRPKLYSSNSILFYNCQLTAVSWFFNTSYYSVSVKECHVCMKLFPFISHKPQILVTVSKLFINDYNHIILQFQTWRKIIRLLSVPASKWFSMFSAHYSSSLTRMWNCCHVSTFDICWYPIPCSWIIRLPLLVYSNLPHRWQQQHTANSNNSGVRIVRDYFIVVYCAAPTKWSTVKLCATDWKLGLQ